MKENRLSVQGTLEQKYTDLANKFFSSFTKTRNLNIKSSYFISLSTTEGKAAIHRKDLVKTSLLASYSVLK